METGFGLSIIALLVSFYNAVTRKIDKKNIFIHQIQFEKEFNCYVNILERLAEVRAALSLVGMLVKIYQEDIEQGYREGGRKWTKEDFSAYNKGRSDWAHKRVTYNIEFEKYRAFYPKGIYSKFLAIDKEIQGTGVIFVMAFHTLGKSDKWFDVGVWANNLKSIEENVSEVSIDIQERIQLIKV